MLRLPPPIWALVYVLLTAGISWALGWPRLLGLPSPLLGVELVALASILPIWAIVLFKRAGTEVNPTSVANRELITSGPYKVLRHPSYLGMLLLAIGAGAVWGNWLGLGVLTLLTLAGVAYRIHVEERALLEELGDRYRSYAEHHKRLIPFVW